MFISPISCDKSYDHLACDIQITLKAKQRERERSLQFNSQILMGLINYFESTIFHRTLLFVFLDDPQGDSYMKGMQMLVILPRVINFGLM